MLNFSGDSFYKKMFIGLVDTLYVNVDLKNNDEDAAYSSQVTIEFPPGLSYIGPGQNQVSGHSNPLSLGCFCFFAFT